MKIAFGIGLIILGIVSLSRFPNLGEDVFETIGALIGAGLLTFLPGILLIRSGNKGNSK